MKFDQTLFKILSILVVYIITVYSICAVVCQCLIFYGIFLPSNFDILNAILFFIGGYTDFEVTSNTAKLIKIFLASSGIIMTALFSSLITMHLIKSNKSIHINNLITILKDSKNNYIGEIFVKNKSTELFQVGIDLIYSQNNEIISHQKLKCVTISEKKSGL